MTLALRPATPADAARLIAWHHAPHLREALGDDDWGWEVELARDPDWRQQLIAEVDGVAIGFIQIIDPEREDSHYWGDCGPGLRAIDIWIGEPAYLGRGHGTAMMRAAIDACFAAADVDAIVIDPIATNAAALRFYRRLGFRFVEDRAFGDDRCAVHRLERATWAAAAISGPRSAPTSTG